MSLDNVARNFFLFLIRSSFFHYSICQLILSDSQIGIDQDVRDFSLSRAMLVFDYNERAKRNVLVCRFTRCVYLARDVCLHMLTLCVCCPFEHRTAFDPIVIKRFSEFPLEKLMRELRTKNSSIILTINWCTNKVRAEVHTCVLNCKWIWMCTVIASQSYPRSTYIYSEWRKNNTENNLPRRQYALRESCVKPLNNSKVDVRKTK